MMVPFSVNASQSIHLASLKTDIRANLKDSNISGAQTIGESNKNSLIDIVFNVIQVILGFLGLIAFVLIIYAGFLWMTSAGGPEQIKKAKGILKEAAIGLVIIFASYALVKFVIEGLVTATSTTSPAPADPGGVAGDAEGVL